MRIYYSNKGFALDLIEVLLETKEYIKDGSDCIWTPYNTPQEIRDAIDQYIIDLKDGKIEVLNEIKMRFAATGTYQEHAISNGWSDEYMKLAVRVDRIFCV